MLTPHELTPMPNKAPLEPQLLARQVDGEIEHQTADVEFSWYYWVSIAAGKNHGILKDQP